MIDKPTRGATYNHTKAIYMPDDYNVLKVSRFTAFATRFTR